MTENITRKTSGKQEADIQKDARGEKNAPGAGGGSSAYSVMGAALRMKAKYPYAIGYLARNPGMTRTDRYLPEIFDCMPEGIKNDYRAKLYLSRSRDENAASEAEALFAAYMTALEIACMIIHDGRTGRVRKPYVMFVRDSCSGPLSDSMRNRLSAAMNCRSCDGPGLYRRIGNIAMIAWKKAGCIPDADMLYRDLLAWDSNEDYVRRKWAEQLYLYQL